MSAEMLTCKQHDDIRHTQIYVDILSLTFRVQIYDHAVMKEI